MIGNREYSSKKTTQKQRLRKESSSGGAKYHMIMKIAKFKPSRGKIQ